MMQRSKILITAFSIALALNAPSLALAQEKKSEAGVATPQQDKPAFEFGLEDGTPVKLKLLRDLSSAKERAGEPVEFEVIEEIRAGDALIVKQGARAFGTVVQARPARRMGRTGKLDVRIDAVEMMNGEKAPLRAVRYGPDGSHAKNVAANVALSGLLFFPVAPFFLLQKGDDIKVPKGTLVTAFVNGNLPLERAKFTRQPGAESKPER
jgi:hypothetical protein